MDKLDLILNQSIAPILGLAPEEITNQVFDNWLREKSQVDVNQTALQEVSARAETFLSQFTS